MTDCRPAVLAALRVQGELYSNVRPAVGGHSGRVYVVTDANGVDCVLKLITNSWETTVAQAELIGLLKGRHYPTPRPWRPVRTAAGTAVIQQQLVGNEVDSLEHGFVDQLLSLNELQGGIGVVEGLGSFKDLMLESLSTGLVGYRRSPW